MRSATALIGLLAACGPSAEPHDAATVSTESSTSYSEGSSDGPEGSAETIEVGDTGSGGDESTNGADEAAGWGGSGSTGFAEPSCTVACSDLAREAIASCPQLADGAPDHACIADALPEECLVESLDDDTEACLFGGLGYPECPLPSLDGMCAN